MAFMCDIIYNISYGSMDGIDIHTFEQSSGFVLKCGFIDVSDVDVSRTLAVSFLDDVAGDRGAAVTLRGVPGNHNVVTVGLNSTQVSGYQGFV